MVLYEMSRVWCYDDPDCFEEDEELYFVRAMAKKTRPRLDAHLMRNDLRLFLVLWRDGKEYAWNNYLRSTRDLAFYIGMEELGKMLAMS